MNRLTDPDTPVQPGQHPAFIRFLLLVTVIIWGSTFVATKICLVYLTPAEVLGLRLLLALPVLYGLILFHRIKLNFTLSEMRKLLLGSGVITLHFLIQIIGLQYTSATNGGWIISVTPLA